MRHQNSNLKKRIDTVFQTYDGRRGCEVEPLNLAQLAEAKSVSYLSQLPRNPY